MKIYIDNDYKCHTSNPDGIFREVETDFFDGKCDSYIEGYRYVPAEENWTNSEGQIFTGEMAAPWKPYTELAYAQLQHETKINEEALAVLGVTV